MFQELLRWLQEDEDDDGNVEETENPKSSGSKAKQKQQRAKEKQKDNKKKKQKKEKKGDQDGKSSQDLPEVKDNGKAKGGQKSKQHGAYVAGDYSQRRKQWIQKRKTEKGMAYKEACAAWNTSRTRERLLADMPHSEKVRRRFVSKSGAPLC